MTYLEKIKKEFGDIITSIIDTYDDGIWICLSKGYISKHMKCENIQEGIYKTCYKILKEGVKAD